MKKFNKSLDAIVNEFVDLQEVNGKHQFSVSCPGFKFFFVGESHWNAGPAKVVTTPDYVSLDTELTNESRQGAFRAHPTHKYFDTTMPFESGDTFIYENLFPGIPPTVGGNFVVTLSLFTVEEYAYEPSIGDFKLV